MKQESLDGHGEWRLPHRTDTAGFGMRVPTHRQMTTEKQFTHHARTAAFVVVSYAHVRLRLRGQIDGDHDQGSFLERWEKLSPPPCLHLHFASHTVRVGAQVAVSSQRIAMSTLLQRACSRPILSLLISDTPSCEHGMKA
jgi:hypothetical protein